LAKYSQPIRYSIEDKGGFVPVDVNRWICEHILSDQPGLLDDAGAGSVYAH
jgi:hypothetical protein